MTAPTLNIPEKELKQFREEGYMILPKVLPDEYLQILRDECQTAIDREDHWMDEHKTDVRGINHRNKRYFISHCYREQPSLRKVLFSKFFAEICRATLGPDAYVFWEQYVVKGAEVGMKFSWHQDSGYVGYPDHKPYLTCWIPLDDVTEENGTVYVLPFSTVGIKSWVKHIREEGSNDMVGYFGKERGVPVIVPAGSIAAFTSLNFHSSGANTTNKMRRVYLAQYSAEKIMSADGKELAGAADPILKDGNYVGEINAPQTVGV